MRYIDTSGKKNRKACTMASFYAYDRILRVCVALFLVVMGVGCQEKAALPAAEVILTVSNPSFEVDSDEGTINVEVNAVGAEWRYAKDSQAGWITDMRKNATGNMLQIIYKSNNTSSSRSAKVQISAGTKTVTVLLTQAAPASGEPPKTILIEGVSNPLILASVLKGDTLVRIKTSNDWSATSDATDWLNVAKENLAAMRINYKTNTSTLRKGNITLTVGEYSTVLVVSQPAGTGESATSGNITVMPAVFTWPGSPAASATVTITAPQGWTATSNVDWINPVIANATTLTLEYTENTGTLRHATVTITAGSDNLNIQITQVSAELSTSAITFTQVEDIYPHIAAQYIIYVQIDGRDLEVSNATTTFWEVASASDWIVARRVSAHIPNKQNLYCLEVDFQSNKGLTRTGEINISYASSSKLLSIAQQADPAAVIALNPQPPIRFRSVVTGPFNINVRLHSSVSEWSVSDNSDWFTSKKINTETLEIIYRENIGSQRSAQVTVTSGDFSRSVDILQLGGAPIVKENQESLRAQYSTYERFPTNQRTFYNFVRTRVPEHLTTNPDPVPYGTKFTYTGTIDSDFASGEGTPGDPYVIRNFAQLQKIGKHPTAHYVLGEDIDASASPFVSAYKTTFVGLFNGKGHSIYNLNIALSNSINGLFYKIGEVVDHPNSGEKETFGTVTNLILVDPRLGASEAMLGSGGLIAGESAGLISNVHISGGLTSIDKNHGPLGGLVGKTVPGSLVLYCSSSSYLSSEGDVLGGLVGHSTGGLIIYSYTIGTVSARSFVGGIVGNMDDGAVKSCFFSGIVSALLHNSAGIAGSISQGNLSNCFSRGHIQGGISAKTAGISVGIANNSYSIAQVTNGLAVSETGNRNYYNREVSTGGNGIALLLSQLRCPLGPGANCANARDIYKDWDSEIWDFGSNLQLPLLRFDPQQVSISRYND